MQCYRPLFLTGCLQDENLEISELAHAARVRAVLISQGQLQNKVLLKPKGRSVGMPAPKLDGRDFTQELLIHFEGEELT